MTVIETSNQAVDFIEILPQSTAAFSNGGSLIFDYTMSDFHQWIPNRSYVEIQMSAVDSSGNALDYLDASGNVNAGTPVQHWPSRLFNRCNHSINGTSVAWSTHPLVEQMAIYQVYGKSGQNDVSDVGFVRDITKYNTAMLDGTNEQLCAGFRPPMMLYMQSRPIIGGRHRLQLDLRSDILLSVSNQSAVANVYTISNMRLILATAKPQIDVSPKGTIEYLIPFVKTEMTSLIATSGSLTQSITVDRSVYMAVLTFAGANDAYYSRKQTVASYQVRFRGQSFPQVLQSAIFGDTSDFSDRMRVFLRLNAGADNLDLEDMPSYNYLDMVGTGSSGSAATLVTPTSDGLGIIIDLSHRNGDQSNQLQLYVVNGPSVTTYAVLTLFSTSRIDFKYDNNGQLSATEFIQDSV